MISTVPRENERSLALRIFIDSANIEEIREINAMGFLAGVTTNPSLVAKQKRDYPAIIREICSIVEGPISAEVLGSESHEMIREAHDLASIHPNVVVKIPVTAEGLKAIKTLAGDEIPTNATLIFSAAQALLAARAGARYVSPFLGRVDDTGNDGLTLLSDMVAIFDQYDLPTEIIAASIRHPVHVVESARIGSHIATVPYNIIKLLIRHPLTDAGIEKFMQDWNQVL